MALVQNQFSGGTDVVGVYFVHFSTEHGPFYNFLSSNSCLCLLMGRKKWTTNPQEDWLLERVPGFVQSQKDKSSSTFLAHLYSEFHKLWPYREPTDEEIAQNMEKEDTGEEGEKEKATEKAKAKAKAIIFQEENKVSIVFHQFEITAHGNKSANILVVLQPLAHNNFWCRFTTRIEDPGIESSPPTVPGIFSTILRIEVETYY